MLYINLYSPTEKRQYGTEIELLKTQGRVLNSSTFHTSTFIPKILYVIIILLYDLTLLRCKTCAIDIGSLKATYLLTYLLTHCGRREGSRGLCRQCFERQELPFFLNFRSITCITVTHVNVCCITYCKNLAEFLL